MKLIDLISDFIAKKMPLLIEKEPDLGYIVQKLKDSKSPYSLRIEHVLSMSHIDKIQKFAYEVNGNVKMSRN